MFFNKTAAITATVATAVAASPEVKQVGWGIVVYVITTLLDLFKKKYVTPERPPFQPVAM